MLKSITNNRLAVDLDEVLANTFEIVLSLHKQKWYLHHLQFDDLINQEWRRIDNSWIDKDSRYAIWREFLSSDLMHNASPVEWSIEAIEKLSEKWIELHIITARPSHLDKHTNDWVNKCFNNKFKDIHFSTSPEDVHTPKYEICKKLWINTIIEDNMDYAMELANNNIKVIILERPWNKHRKEKHKNIIRIKCWNDIIKNI